jgi:hypothetical protein
MKTVVRNIALAAALATLALAPLAAAERPYDKQVEGWIDDAYRGLDRFADEMNSKAKGAKVTRDGVETDISDFMKDFKSAGRLLRERYGSDDMASLNALEFLRKGKGTDGFVQRHPGFTGADSEWASLRPTLVNLAAAYNIDWESDPATWRPVRTSDKAILSMLTGLEKQAKDLGKATTKAGKAAKVDKAALKGITDSIATLAGSGKAFSAAFKKQQPIGSAADGFFGNLERVESALAGVGLEGATASAMTPLTSAAKSLTTALGR